MDLRKVSTQTIAFTLLALSGILILGYGLYFEIRYYQQSAIIMFVLEYYYELLISITVYIVVLVMIFSRSIGAWMLGKKKSMTPDAKKAE